MRFLQALKRVVEDKAKDIEVEEKALDEKRSLIQKKLAQSKTACDGLSISDKLLKGLYFTGWITNPIETPEMVQGQEYCHVHFMAIVDEKNILPVQYQKTLYNKEKEVAEMQVIVAEIREKMGKYKEWYPIILNKNPYYVNYFESRLR
jgi:hypothetical protein